MVSMARSVEARRIFASALVDELLHDAELFTALDVAAEQRREVMAENMARHPAQSCCQPVYFATDPPAEHTIGWTGPSPLRLEQEGGPDNDAVGLDDGDQGATVHPLDYHRTQVATALHLAEQALTDTPTERGGQHDHRAGIKACSCGEPWSPGTHRVDGPCLAQEEQPVPAPPVQGAAVRVVLSNGRGGTGTLWPDDEAPFDGHYVVQVHELGGPLPPPLPLHGPHLVVGDKVRVDLPVGTNLPATVPATLSATVCPDPDAPLDDLVVVADTVPLPHADLLNRASSSGTPAQRDARMRLARALYDQARWETGETSPGWDQLTPTQVMRHVRMAAAVERAGWAPVDTGAAAGDTATT